jgi:hypothetical protein
MLEQLALSMMLSMEKAIDLTALRHQCAGGRCSIDLLRECSIAPQLPKIKIFVAEF